MDNQLQKDLMIRAAWMYYGDNMTHEQIAETLHLSRVKVTRLLQRAREEGIVEINVTHPLPDNYQVGRTIEQTFGIQEAVIAHAFDDEEKNLDEIGRTAAEYLAQITGKGCRLGFGWSRTVSTMSNHLKVRTTKMGCYVSDLVGSMLGQNNPYSVSGKVADAFQIPLHALPVPVVVRNNAARDAMLNDPNIANTLQLGRQSDVAFVGVGNIGFHSTIVASNYLAADEMKILQAKGVVGDILLRFYDINGEFVRTEFDNYTIGLDWNEIQRIQRVVVVATGELKIEAVLGILRSGLCNVLITNIKTAQSVLEIAS